MLSGSSLHGFCPKTRKGGWGGRRLMTVSGVGGGEDPLCPSRGTRRSLCPCSEDENKTWARAGGAGHLLAWELQTQTGAHTRTLGPRHLATHSSKSSWRGKEETRTLRGRWSKPTTEIQPQFQGGQGCARVLGSQGSRAPRGIGLRPTEPSPQLLGPPLDGTAEPVPPPTPGSPLPAGVCVGRGGALAPGTWSPVSGGAFGSLKVADSGRCVRTRILCAAGFPSSCRWQG